MLQNRDYTSLKGRTGRRESREVFVLIGDERVLSMISCSRILPAAPCMVLPLETNLKYECMPLQSAANADLSQGYIAVNINSSKFVLCERRITKFMVLFTTNESFRCFLRSYFYRII